MIRYASFKQTKVRFSDKGKGRAIVLLHGFLESLEVWDELSDRLAKQYRVIAIDLPGFGGTPSIGYVHSMELMAECVKAVMDSIGYRRYVLVGHSMGGYTALAFAELYNDNVSGLCLMNSTAAPDSEEKKKNRDTVIKIIKENPRHFINAFYETLFSPVKVDRFRKEIEQLKERSEKFAKQGIVNALEGMKDRKKREGILEMAEYPVLFVIGKQDGVIPYQSVLDQAKQARDSTVLLLENSAHMSFYEEKEPVLKALRKFVRKSFRNG